MVGLHILSHFLLGMWQSHYLYPKTMLLSPVPFGRRSGAALTTSIPVVLRTRNKPRRASMAHLPTCSFPLWVSPPGWPAVIEDDCALDLLPLWGNLTCVEAVHHNFRDSIIRRI